MSSKDCGNHGHCKRHKLLRRVLAVLLALIIVIGLVVLIVWLVLRPTRPKFYLQDATVTQFNFSSAGTDQPNYSPNLLTSIVQVTISSRNPNDHIGIYYDKLDVFLQYKGQQLTTATALPPGYQGHNSVTVWSPFLLGTGVPVAPYLATAISQDKNAGFLLLNVKVDGRLRWKVGTWISSHYHIQASCPAFLSVDTSKPNAGSPFFRFQQISRCNVDV